MDTINNILSKDKEKDKTPLFLEVNRRVYSLNVSLKQSYQSVVTDVRAVNEWYSPYKNFDSFKQQYYKQIRKL